MALMPAHPPTFATRGLRLLRWTWPSEYREIGIVARRPLDRAPLAGASWRNAC